MILPRLPALISASFRGATAPQINADFDADKRGNNQIHLNT